MLENYIRQRLKSRNILLMTHMVIGYPSLQASFDLVRTMVNCGVDLMELQIPFSEPIADGPVIMKANQQALAGNITVSRCLEFAGQVCRSFEIPFLIMSYYNPIFKYGVADFVSAMARQGIKGCIVADLPPEEGGPYLEAMDAQGLDPVFILAPTTPAKRMSYIASHSRGMVYCVARKGVTGRQTEFSATLADYLARCRRATELPLAVGFGVASGQDVAYLTGKAAVAVIGTRSLEIMDQDGLPAVGDFLGGLRQG